MSASKLLGDRPYSLEDLFAEYQRIANELDPVSEKARISVSRNSAGDAKRRIARLREDARSALVARCAELSEEVIAFRRSELKGKLLSVAILEQWIVRRANAEGAPSRWTEVPVPPSFQISRTEKGGIGLHIEPGPVDVTFSYDRKCGSTSSAYRVLRYRNPAEQRRLIAANGVLERLRNLSIKLADQFSWDESEAATFVLTGKVPRLSDVRAKYLPKEVGPSSRIHLDVDPSVTPSDIARVYRQFRKRVLSRQTRVLSEKHLMLAMVEEPKRDGAPNWESVLEAWNREHPNYRYKDVHYFKRDALKARERLLDPGYSEIETFDDGESEQ